MQRKIYLPAVLYGTLEYGPDRDFEWQIAQSSVHARLRDISLNSTPSRLVPHGTAASRFQHSMAVAHLARRLCEVHAEFRPYELLLVAAALCHDAGSPPFSHISEAFLYDLTGRTHEEQTLELLADGQELHAIFTEFGVDAAQVVEIVTGRHPLLGLVIAGSIDLDNLDNTIHLLASFGYTENLPYHPLRLVEAFRLIDGQVSLDAGYLSDLLGWAQARQDLYRVLRSEAHNSTASMLYRALAFAYDAGALDASFFALGESEALNRLRSDCGEQAGYLVDQALTWHQFPVAYERTCREEDPRLVGLYADWRAHKQVADQIADELGLAPHELALYVGRDRGEKSITLPFIGDRAQPAAQLFSGRPARQQVAVFCDKRLITALGRQQLAARVERALDRAVAGLPEVANAHVFF